MTPRLDSQAVRRLALLALLAALLSGCSATAPGGGHHVTTPTPSSVVGALPQTSGPKGDPAAGKQLFAANACASCHTFQPVNATGKVGPDLDKLPAEAKQANRGTFDQFVTQSIVAPDAYIAPGFPNAMPKFKLSTQQVADLVAFLTQGSKAS